MNIDEWDDDSPTAVMARAVKLLDQAPSAKAAEHPAHDHLTCPCCTSVPEYLPHVEIAVTGDVGRAESEEGDEPHWLIYAEADRDDSIRVQVALDWEPLADVRVYQSAENVGMWDEAQDIAAAILWSGLRAWHLSRIKGGRDV